MTLEEFLRSNIHAIAMINFQHGGVQWVVGRIESVTQDGLDLVIKVNSLNSLWSLTMVSLEKITKVTILTPRNPDDPKYSFPFPK